MDGLAFRMGASGEDLVRRSRESGNPWVGEGLGSCTVSFIRTFRRRVSVLFFFVGETLWRGGGCWDILFLGDQGCEW